jgi:osmotically-inducible protein OsmY
MGNAAVGAISRRLLLAAVLAAALAACGSAPEKRNAGEFTDDAALTAKVKSAIATDVGARAAGALNVDIYKGVVQLSGFVDNEETARGAARAAQKVGGVRSVKSDIRLKSSS